MPNWDADLYLRFAEERTQPAIDLLARVAVAAPRRVIDLGCGPGNSTALLRQRWPDAQIIGLDNSEEMITAAAKSYPAGAWLGADVRSWSDPVPFDVIFSNAAFQWVPDHAALLPRLFHMVAAGGALAMQMPRHLQSPVHQLMLEISTRPEWNDRMERARTAVAVESPAFYYDTLQPLAARIDLWETEYQHVLSGPHAIVSWIRGTGLRPYLDALANDDERSRFETLLLAGVEQAYPRHPDGMVLFPFRRVFVVAYRS
ncbi:MAG: trans-aconitate 2-methyltransferase [Gemmataceae bacterium]|nr:trans-aconitate 2-methyltransferase [Gemmataceae bacterium]